MFLERSGFKCSHVENKNMHTEILEVYGILFNGS